MRKSRYYKTLSRRQGHSIGRRRGDPVTFRSQRKHNMIRLKRGTTFVMSVHVHNLEKMMQSAHNEIVQHFTCPLCEAHAPVEKRVAIPCIDSLSALDLMVVTMPQKKFKYLRKIWGFWLRVKKIFDFFACKFV